jgi:hypothetical protein
MARKPNPTVKIKRNTNFTPTTQLTTGELGVDLGTSRLYVGNNTGAAVPISAAVDTDVNLGSTNPSDNKITTENAARQYIINKVSSIPSNTDKNTLIATISAQQASVGTSIQNIDLSSAVIQQTANMNLQIQDPNFPLYSGFFQTSKTEMFLNVNYSLHVSSISSNAIVTEGTNLGFWRVAGLRVIDTNNPTNVTYYGMQVMLPIIGDTNPVFALPTLISGNACVRLPKYVSSGTQWELQLVYQIKSFDQLLDIGTGGTNQEINDPVIGSAKGIRIQIAKLSESVT